MADVNSMLYYSPQWQLTNVIPTDSLGPFASYKTATYTLTDALLGQLTNNVILNTGTRSFLAPQSMGGNRLTDVAAPVNNADGVNKQYVDNAVSTSIEFLESVLSVNVYAQPIAPEIGDRYLLGLSQAQVVTGASWVGHGGEIAGWNGTIWTFYSPTKGDFVNAEDTNIQYVFNGDSLATGGVWVIFSSGALVSGDGIDITAQVISVEILPNGGLEFVGGELAVNEAQIIDGNSLYVNGSADIAIQFSNTALMNQSRAVSDIDLRGFGTNQGAKILGFDPTNVPQTTATTIQAAIEDSFNFASTNTPGFTLIAGVNINKGWCLFVQNSDIAGIYLIQSPLGSYPIGLAQGTVTTGSNVKIAKNNAKLSGVLTGATAGQQLFWNNLTSSHEPTAPSTAGYAIVRSGYAANSQDLIVDVQLLRING